MLSRDRVGDLGVRRLGDVAVAVQDTYTCANKKTSSASPFRKKKGRNKEKRRAYPGGPCGS
jgi:hypothetical protein